MSTTSVVAGLFQVLQPVADGADKEAPDSPHEMHENIKTEALARGLICYPMGGAIDDQHGNHALLSPP